ncbi:MAG: hypothetical protein ACRCYS_15140 [Beijerinckiaceae bacterium]
MATAALNHIRATRVHSDTDRRVIAEARELQRRLRRAEPYSLGTRARQLGKWLHNHRSRGFPSDVQWFLADYRLAILSEVERAEMRARQAIASATGEA